MSYSQSSDSSYVASQTPETEDYTSYESSSLETPSESEYSIECSEDCSDVSSVTESSDLSSSYFVESSQEIQ